MRILNFPLCCSATVIADFGGGHVGQTENHTKKVIIDWVKGKLTMLKREHNTAVVFAIPTSTQPNAIAALEELGFYGAPNPKTCSRTKREAHKMYPMFLPMQEWDEKKFNSEYNPEKDKYVDKPNWGRPANNRNDGFW